MQINKLHLGCFDKPVNGWLNTDITPHIFISRVPGLALMLYKFGKMTEERYQQHVKGVFRHVKYLDVTKRFPYKSNTFKCVYTSHMLEHLFPWQAEFCLKEVFRVLNKKGLLRISVPDLDQMINEYSPENAESFLDSFFEIEQTNLKNQHHWHYNEFLINNMLKSIGFSNIIRHEFLQGNCPNIDILDNRPASLFIEAEKP